MKDCVECDLAGYCYSDPEVWEFESRSQAEEIAKRIRECHEETLTEVRQERGISNSYPSRENGSTALRGHQILAGDAERCVHK